MSIEKYAKFRSCLNKRTVCKNRKQIPRGLVHNKIASQMSYPPNMAYGIGPGFHINYVMLELHLAELNGDTADWNANELVAVNLSIFTSLKKLAKYSRYDEYILIESHYVML